MDRRADAQFYSSFCCISVLHNIFNEAVELDLILVTKNKPTDEQY